MATPSASKPTDLLNAVIQAHGGLEAWNKIASIDLTMNFSGWFLSLKGYPEHYQPTVTIDIKNHSATLRGLGNQPGETFHFTPQRTWVEQEDGSVTQDRPDPRRAFAGHTRTSPWDVLHLTYFVCYAIYCYLVTPFSFTWPGFQTRELEEHEERGERWRVLEVTYPDGFATHTKVQKFYFDDKYMLQRLDYAPDVTQGDVAHYCFDHKEVGGITFPMFRRVVPRDAETGQVRGGPSVFTLDFSKITLHQHDGQEIICRGAYWDVAPQNKL